MGQSLHSSQPVDKQTSVQQQEGNSRWYSDVVAPDQQFAPGTSADAAAAVNSDGGEFTVWHDRNYTKKKKNI